jgi:hypothetical protein
MCFAANANANADAYVTAWPYRIAQPKRARTGAKIVAIQRAGDVQSGGATTRAARNVVQPCAWPMARHQIQAFQGLERPYQDAGPVCPELPDNRTLHGHHKATRMTQSGHGGTAYSITSSTRASVV